MKKTLLFLAIMLLTACDVPQDQVVELRPEVELAKENNVVVPEPDCTKDDLSQSNEKTETCIADMATLNEKITSLEKSLSLSQNSKGNSSSIYNDILIEYLNNVEQKEFAFDSCGPVSGFYKEAWFNGFKEKLAGANVFFTPRKQALESQDFYGACKSSAGQIAVFLGASYENEDEFNLMKYDYGNGVLSKAIVANGKCEDCPVQFLKRNGAYISMEGGNGTLYRYYFNKNILAEEGSFATEE